MAGKDSLLNGAKDLEWERRDKRMDAAKPSDGWISKSLQLGQCITSIGTRGEERVGSEGGFYVAPLPSSPRFTCFKNYSKYCVEASRRYWHRHVGGGGTRNEAPAKVTKTGV